jgi:threonylcarbamoyladenosine tRNA methylthiotransferase MtaB
VKVYIYTLGCRLNQCESEAVADSFREAGWIVEKESQDAELIIVNTCAVTSKAEQKARRMIRLFSSSASCVIVSGCYAEEGKAALESLGSNVVVFSLKDKPTLLKIASYLSSRAEVPLLERVRSFTLRDTDSFSYNPSSFSYHSRAYLKIQDGCDNSCGYCKTTIVRGPSRWLESDEVVKRVLKLEEEGLHEIMLTGVNLTNYDHNGEGLGGLMKNILSACGKDIRFRLSSMEPDGVDDLLLEQIADSRVFPHFHIPIQTASEHVLSIIGRRYSISHVEYIIKTLREIKDDPFIACDVIAGLPGETDEDAAITYRFMEDNDFSAMHVFPYSPREGTPLYGSRLFVEERIRDERAAALRLLSNRHERQYIERQKGKKCEIIAEKNGSGTTGNYLKAALVSESGREMEEGGLYSGVISSVFPVTVSVD